MATDIEYDNYEKLSDDIAYIGFNTVMRMNVNLSYKNENGERQSFHKEYRYRNSKYNNVSNGITIRRRFDYYISIENIKENNGEKAYIRLYLKDIPHFRDTLYKASEWFINSKFKNLFIIKNKMLSVNMEIPPLIVDGLSMDNYMIFMPVAINDPNMTKYNGPGARILLSSQTNFVDLTADMILGLLEFFNTFNIFQSAQTMLNYIQRPAYGTNLYSFNGEENDIEELDDMLNTNSNKISRQIPVKRHKSIFDKIDDL